MEGEADLAGQLGQHAVVLLGEGLAVVGPAADDEAEQLALVGERRDRGTAELGWAPRSSGSQISSQRPPDTPARATTGRSFSPTSSGAGARWGTPVAHS